MGLSLGDWGVGAGTRFQPGIFLVSRLVERIALQLHAPTSGDLPLDLPLINDRNLQMGRLPLRLKVFTDDRTLGLKPFANTSLLLITIYVLAIVLTFPIFLYPNFAVELSLTIFLVLGVFFFLVPLFGLHKKMQEVRTEKSALIGLRHNRVMGEFEAVGEGPLSE